MIRLLLIVIMLCAVTGCARQDAPRAPGAIRNVVLITIDTLRPDRVGAYGYGPARTRAIYALAARGTRFTRAYAAAPITLTSHASILTGRYPPGPDRSTPTGSTSVRRCSGRHRLANLGTVASDSGHAERGIAPLQRAIAIDADFHEARFNLALAFARIGQRADAAREAGDLLRRLPADAPQRTEVARRLAAVR